MRKKEAWYLGSVAAVGAPLWCFFVWYTWDLIKHTPSFLIFVTIVCVLAGLAWGWAMWNLFPQKPRRAEQRQADDS